jgi:5S rRNA maturation endonuclease (ribonuclease M5)
MYDFEKTVEVDNLKDILKLTTEYDIYSFYMGNQFKIGKVMRSPLREDIHPSFGIYKSSLRGNLMWKDQATGKTGNVIHFVSELFKITYEEATAKIVEDIENNSIKTTKEGKEVQEVYSKTKTIISVQKKNFTEVDDDYWEQYLITREILKKHNVYPILTFWVNDMPSNLFYSKEQPLYAYQIFDKFQIYSPKANRKNKFRNSTSIFDIHGLEQLPKYGKLLIITKSKKDVMVLDRLGYNSVAPCGENTPIPESIIQNLKERFDNIIILYDNDKAGMEGAKKLADTYNLTYVYIPIDYHIMFKIKDISDYIKNFKITRTRELLKKLLTCEKG